ncbi:MAG: alpha/beta fold hydrolase [Anaerolineales bacterium]|nr:alpha/beta fold hydrolase [Anaerolineales bacterium]
MNDEEGYLLVDDGVRLYYSTVGVGTKEVIIPSACGLKADLEEPLVHGRKLIFYDMRGRGESDVDPQESRLWTDYEVHDLEAIRQHFELERVSIMGWSYMGGVCALYAATHPDRVERLILMCPVSPRSDAPYDDPEEAERKATARLDPAGVERLKAMQEAGKDIKDPVDYCREDIRVYYPQKMGKPEALKQMRSDRCVFSNEWPHNLSEHWRKHFPPESLERD